MIHDTLDAAEIYSPLSPAFRLGFEFLQRFDPATPDGRIALDGDRVFALVQSYATTPASERMFEAHRIHADLQFVASGEEAIYYSPLTRLRENTPYSAEKDIALFDGENDIPLVMPPGFFAILLPQDGHKPCCVWGAPAPVKKVVVKIRL
jgi:YhcH/YjgK/YiaL family protein